MPASAVARINFLAAADGRVESISALLDHPPDSTAEYDETSTSTIAPAAADYEDTPIITPTAAEDTSTTTPTAADPSLTAPTPAPTALITPTALSAANQSESHTTDAVPDNIRTEGNHRDYDDGTDEGHINDEGGNINEDAALDEDGNIDEETNHDEEPDNADSTRRERMLNVFRFGTETAMKVSVTEALRTRGDAARAVINAELQQMITRKVWSEDARVIRSIVFLKEKFLPTGEFEKLKARLVAGGDMQNRDLYEDLSAPTVATASVFTLLSIAAAENQSIAAVDIGGAFLHADMGDKIKVHIRLEPRLSSMMVELDGGYIDYIDKKGCLTVKLDKALYGYVESAGL